MKAGSWTSIISIYAFAVIGVASITKLIPLQHEFQTVLGATPGQYAWLIALLGVPPALFSVVGGAIVDRVAPYKILIYAGLVGIAADLLNWFAPSIGTFQLFRLLEGVALVGVFTGGPALLMATTEGRKRTLAMTLWSTSTPIGASIGLLVGSAYAGTPDWRTAFPLHAILVVVAVIAATRLPHVAPSAPPGAGWRGLIAAYRQSGPCRLALAWFFAVSISFGVSTVIPSHMASAHNLSVATAAQITSALNLFMVVGAFLCGMLLSRGARPSRLFLALALSGSIAGSVMFYPSTGFELAVAMLAVWFVAMGAGSALIVAVLPSVAAPEQRGAAAGLISQSSAVATLVNPPVWVPLSAAGASLPIIGLVVAGWFLAVLLLNSIKLGANPQPAKAAA